MESAVVFVLILATITFKTAPAYGQSIHASENPLPVGSNVTLTSQANITTGLWMFKSEFVMILPGKYVISNGWLKRVTFNPTNSSLTIRSLHVEDSGLYTLQDVNSYRAQINLSVQVHISGVTLKANATNLVEYNDTVVLMCSVANGTSLSYVWLKGDSKVTTGSNVQISDGGATLTIVRVTRYDEGPFKCNVSNGISNDISLPVHLNISYGPSNTTMTHMKSIYKTGSNITLSCSAESSPPATIQWLVNGVYLNQFTPQLQLERVTESDSGNYQCLFHNTATSRFTSASAMIKILAPIAAVVVIHSGGPAILNKMFMMTCEVNGSVDRIQWWRNGNPISADNTTVLANRTLTLNPVQHSDNGVFQCQAFNYVSNRTSSAYTVDVNYGPEVPAITGPNAAEIGVNVTLSCNASSNPLSTYKWFYNDTLVANTSEYVTPPLTRSMSGTYTCMAFNNVTGKNSTAYKMLIVVDQIVDVQVEAPMTPAKEGHSYTLTCKVTGPFEHVYWLKNGELLHKDSTTAFSTDNTTVTFNPLGRNDTGNYQCLAMNAIWNMTSPLYKLLVIFGPDTPIIDGPAFAETGRTAVFNCSAESIPPSQFSWWYNGSKVANTSVFETAPLSFNMSGEYTCLAYNNVTGKNSTNSKMLTVIEAIESVVITANKPPISSDNFTLTCNVTGPYDTIYWMRNNVRLSTNTSTPTANMSYHIENDTLYFASLLVIYDGEYQCVATNKAGSHPSATFTLAVIYGPVLVTIHGPDSAKFGFTVSLKCIAVSQPECDFSWYFNYKSSVVGTGSVYTFPAMKETEGNYTCEARNPVTNKTMSNTQAFIVDHASTLHIPSQGVLMLMGLFALSVTVLFN